MSPVMLGDLRDKKLYRASGVRCGLHVKHKKVPATTMVGAVPACAECARRFAFLTERPHHPGRQPLTGTARPRRRSTR